MVSEARTLFHIFLLCILLLCAIVVHINDLGNVLLRFKYRKCIITLDPIGKGKRIEPGAAFDAKTFYGNNNFGAYIKPIDHNSLLNEKDLSPGERNTVNSFYSRMYEHRFYPRIKLIRKDYTLERGYLYDHIRIPHPWPLPSRWLQKNHKYIIFTIHLDDEENVRKLNLPNRFNNWEKRYQSTSSIIREKYIANGVKTNKLNVTSGSKVTQLTLLSCASPWLHFKNVCYDVYTKHFIVYNTTLSEDIQANWNIQVASDPIPETSWIEDDGIYFIKGSNTIDELTFWKFSSELLHVITAPTIYPNVNTIIFFERESMPLSSWQTTVLQSILSIFPANNSVSVLFSPSLNHSSTVCYRTLTVLNEWNEQYTGGLWGGWVGVDLMRSFFYKQYNQSIVTPSISKISVLYLNENIRNIYYQALQSFVSKDVSVDYMSWREKSMKTIILSITQHDVLVAVRHAELVNVLWMRPRSAFIEVFSPFCVDFYTFHLAQLARVFYIAVTDFDYNHVRVSKAVVDEWIENGLLESHSKTFQNRMSNPNLFQFIYAVRDGIDYVKHIATEYILNDFWSSIFY